MKPTHRVLDLYTTASITRAVTGRDDSWADAWRHLLTVPEAWRQSVWAAAHKDAYRTMSDHQGCLYFAPTGRDLNRCIGDRIHLFHLGFRPARTEYPIAED